MKNDYPEMVSFMRNFGNDFRLNVCEISVGFKQGLFELIDEDVKAGRDVLKAIFMGTRRDDPDGKHQPTFSPTDPSWPPLCRVNPILEFNYHDIWRFLRIYNLPYCSLYDKGFTSIGTIDDTTTNELLWDTRLKRYTHPWLLSHGKYERIGRGCRRFFAKRHTLASFLDYPVELLSEITKYLELEELTRLALCGNARLLMKLEMGGVTEVRHADREKGSARTNLASCLRFFGHIRSISCVYIRDTLQIGQIEDIENIYMHLPSTLTSLSVEWSPEANILDIPKTPYLPHLRHLSTGLRDIGEVARIVNPHLETLVLKSAQVAEELNPLLSNLPHLKTLAILPSNSKEPLIIPPKLQSLMVDHYSDILSPIKRLPESLTNFTLLGSYRNSLLPALPASIKKLGISRASQMVNGQVLPRLETLEIGTDFRFSDFAVSWDQLSNHTENIDISSVVKSFSSSSLTRLMATGTELKLCDYASTSWPSGLTDMQFSLRLTSGNAELTRLPTGLRRLYLTIPCSNHEIGGSSHSAFCAQHLDFSLLPRYLTSLRIIHAHFSTSFFPHLPRTLRTLVMAPVAEKNNWPLTEFPIERPELFARLPSSLIELLIGHVEEFAPALPFVATALPNLRRLELWRDNSIEDSHLHLLPRYLQSLILPANTQSFCERLADLPRSLTFIELPRANQSPDKQPSDEQLEQLPLGIQQMVIGSHLRWVQEAPTPLFAWPICAPICHSISHQTGKA